MNIAKIIVTSRYMRNTPKRSATNLVKYMGTREGVERLSVGIGTSPVTIRQQRLVKDIVKFSPSSTEYSEYQDYENSPTKSNASEFIDAFIERNADRIGEMEKLVSYMAERPGVEKLGPHGLFIIKSAVLAAEHDQISSFQEINITPMVKRITLALCRMISQSYSRKLERLNSQIDSKLRLKIEQKKAAHGLKSDRSVQQDMDDEDYGIRM